ALRRSIGPMTLSYPSTQLRSLVQEPPLNVVCCSASSAIATGNIGGIKVVGELVTEEFYGIAMPKDSENLDALNTALNELLENGTYDAIYEKWFGTAPIGSLPEAAF
ncbi:MAG: transporter substrate-binding domain-containing protein, partial [Cyanobacteria bacterium J06649_12]